MQSFSTDNHDLGDNDGHDDGSDRDEDQGDQKDSVENMEGEKEQDARRNMTKLRKMGKTRFKDQEKKEAVKSWTIYW